MATRESTTESPAPLPPDHPSRIDAPPATRLNAALDPREMPEIYAMRVTGTCMEPAIPHGSYLKFSAGELPVPGDLVNLFIRPELVAPGRPQALLKRLVMGPPPWVTFPYHEPAGDAGRAVVIVEQLSPLGFHTFRAADLLGMHRCVGIVSPPHVPHVPRDGVAASRGTAVPS
ncbi:MAG: S24 family peptidase [Alphaproteobacteria bacterium]|nr:S24 family peptidase [Alphaproteobacteria bacterium]